MWKVLQSLPIDRAPIDRALPTHRAYFLARKKNHRSRIHFFNDFFGDFLIFINFDLPNLYKKVIWVRSAFWLVHAIWLVSAMPASGSIKTQTLLELLVCTNLSLQNRALLENNRIAKYLIHKKSTNLAKKPKNKKWP